MSDKDDKLDVSSPDFDALLALYSDQVVLPCPDVQAKDNVSRFEETPEGVVPKKDTKVRFVRFHLVDKLAIIVKVQNSPRTLSWEGFIFLDYLNRSCVYS